MKFAPIALLIVGLLVLVIFGLLAAVSLLLMATSGGKIDPDEAGPFIGLGCCCSVPGLAMAIGGLVWWLVARQQQH